MPKPPRSLIAKWRDLAQAGRFYSDIAKAFPGHTASQIRHYCLGNSGARAPGPIQQTGRWSDNPWLHGEKSPLALLNEGQVLQVLDDWDEEKGYWRTAAERWAKRLKVSQNAILRVRRGDAWKHLGHPNAGRQRGK